MFRKLFFSKHPFNNSFQKKNLFFFPPCQFYGHNHVQGQSQRSGYFQTPILDKVFVGRFNPLQGTLSLHVDISFEYNNYPIIQLIRYIYLSLCVASVCTLMYIFPSDFFPSFFSITELFANFWSALGSVQSISDHVYMCQSHSK